MGTPYSYNVDLRQVTTSHALAVLSVPPGSRVLDLGSADGSVARALKTRGCTVWAVEQDAQAAEAARAICDRVNVGDLERDDVWESLEGQTFDVVLALDVLEHLRNPVVPLQRAARHLKPEGVVIVSLPNVAHGAVRLNLLCGRFNYTPTGLLDHTHLRFFDRQTAEKLIADGGLVISERLRVTRNLSETEIPVVQEEIPPGFLELIERDPDAATYQFVFVARLAEAHAPDSNRLMLSERLQIEQDALREQLRGLEQRARSLEADRQVSSRALGELRSELESTKATVENLTAERDQLARRVEEVATANVALHATLAALRTYASSAGFRLTEKVVVSLKRIPLLFHPLRFLIRAAVRRIDGRR